MANPFKRNKDDLAAKRKAKANLPYRKCGHTRTIKEKNGSVTTVICSQNANVRHKHD
jgi:hypothetical protein